MSTRGFEKWTPQMVAANNMKFGPKPLRIETAVSVLAEIRAKEVKKKTARLDPIAGNFTLSPSKDEQRLNRTERAYLAHLRAKSLVWIGVQNITIKLADDCRLTPDFATVDAAGKLTLIDVKGFQREDAFIKMKVAARSFPMFRFVIVTKNGGGWNERKIST